MKVTFDTFNSVLTAVLDNGRVLKDTVPPTRISELDDYWFGDDDHDINVWNLGEENPLYIADLYEVVDGHTDTSKTLDHCELIMK